ncbi:DUF2130 domain-containing protein [Candidatus Vesicomyidisocius sp. SY067_SCS001]|uniref:DUF2130 domain-containing protein n=1 Tax=Candidatus Vesicomyidisocius sp. SY067_SCS001 TaxID=2732590 RepID=UPI00168A1E86|nr:DUF2130 domain-containing protein [Candidatus Vesicomyosocius sp. SY067_SCS001]
MVHKIECEHCGNKINIEQSIWKSISIDLNSKYVKKNVEIKVREKALNDKKEKQDEEVAFLVAQEKSVLVKEYNNVQKIQAKMIQTEVDKRVILDKEFLDKQIREEVKNDLEDAKQKNIENNKIKIENIRLEATVNTMESQHQVDIEMKVAEAINLSEKKAIEDREQQRSENDVKMKQMQKSIEDAHRQSNQGSMQIQGEAQEQTIESFLKYNFPLDIIEPIKQGARGGDYLQYVVNNNNQKCGIIYYESKRTKNFENSWVQKFKADMREKNVDIGVLVTQAMPIGMKRAGLVKGIWVCSLEEFKMISYILRKQLIEIYKIRGISENREDIVSHLYRYLTSSEFKMDMEAIVEGFTEMRSDIDSEKKAFNRIWSKRGKQLEKIMLSTVNMYGSLQGISNNSIETINGLELPGDHYSSIKE